MKLRTGFVSNSSSSSFMIEKVNLTKEQIEAIRDHSDFARRHMYESIEWPGDAWTITEDDYCIKGSTSMDNFDMEIFLRLIGVDETDVFFD